MILVTSKNILQTRFVGFLLHRAILKLVFERKMLGFQNKPIDSLEQCWVGSSPDFEDSDS